MKYIAVYLREMADLHRGEPEGYAKKVINAYTKEEGYVHYTLSTLLEEAAYEIEQLRKENDNLKYIKKIIETANTTIK